MTTQTDSLVNVYFFGREYAVPSGLTIMHAMEYVGHKFVTGCGCRGGFCGACATAYRIRGENGLKTCLACRKTVEEGMIVDSFTARPLKKRVYDVEILQPTSRTAGRVYPEIYSCVSCNACTRACPQGINVMKYIVCARSGNYAEAARLSFECVACGLCSARCVAKIPHAEVAELSRRLYGKYLAPKSRDLENAVKANEDGLFGAEIDELSKKPLDEIKKLYDERDFER